MRVFVTGASGFVGSAIVKELLSAGHQVLGMVRSDSAAGQLQATGAEVHRGNIYELESVKSGAAVCDAVVHTAFDHDFTKFKENCETDRKVIGALASALAGTAKPLVITSGIGLLPGLDRLITEDDLPKGTSETMPRIASEEAAREAAKQGVDTYIVRLPPTTHGQGDHGFVPLVIGVAKEKGVSAYIGEGQNRWPAVHRFDAATLYRLIVEQRPALKIFHAVAEEGIAFRDIATTIGEGLNLKAVSVSGDAAAEHFGWFQHFAGLGVAASSAKTKATLGWQPKHTELLADMKASYFN